MRLVSLLLFISTFAFSSNIKWKSERINLGAQYPNTYFEFDLNSAIDNPEKEIIQFSILGAPKWMTLKEDIISGKPNYSDIGPYYGILLIAKDSSGAFETAEGYGEVVKTLRPPKWKSDPIALEEALENVIYSTYLANYLDNPDSLQVYFSFLDENHPKWLNITSSGTLFGIPKRIDVGNVSFKIKCETVIGESKISVEGLANLNIKWVNNAPFWKNKTIFLGEIKQNQYFQYDLTTEVDDPDLSLGDSLTFEKIDGPEWLELEKTGRLYGIPSSFYIGENSVVVRVSDLSKSGEENIIKIKVLKVNSPPIVSSDFKFELKEREELSIDLNDKKYVFDPDGDVLEFSLITILDWINLKKDGKLELTPKHSNIGTHLIEFSIKDSEKAEVKGTFTVTVKRNPRPPIWLENPIMLTGVQGKNFTASISNKAKDLDGIPLRFTKVSGPNWLTVKGDGTISGVPTLIEKNTFIVVAENDFIGTEGTIIIEVKAANKPPRWIVDPIILGDIVKDKFFEFDLSSIAIDDDGDKIVFRIVRGPDWLSVNGSKLTGKPTEVGDFHAIVGAADYALSAEAGLIGKVVLPNRPPLIHNEKLIFSIKERDALSILLNNTEYVEDPDKDTLKFNLKSSVNWISLSESGLLIFKPQHSDLGNHPIEFEVSDGTHIVSSIMSVIVLADPRPPIWLEDPIEYTIKVGTEFRENLSIKVKELDNNQITFSKKLGPSWLSISSDGIISGIPKLENEGRNEFIITASSSGGSSNVRLIINVTKEMNIMVVNLDEKLDSPITELIWIIDSSPKTNIFLTSLEKGIEELINFFNSNNLKHSSIILSSRNFNGFPAQAYFGNSYVIKGDSYLYLFKERLNTIWSNNQLNSPTLSLTKFIENSKIHEELKKENYFLKSIPAEVIIFTADSDAFKLISQEIIYESKEISYFQDRIMNFFSQKSKPLTISSIDLRCPPILNSEYPVDPYVYLALSTFGTYYYQTPSCENRVISTILSFAASVLRRTTIFGKSKIYLDKIPIDQKLIKVTLYSSNDATELKGNTGDPTDQWQYETLENAIFLLWHNIKYTLSSDSKIKIEY